MAQSKPSWYLPSFLRSTQYLPLSTGDDTNAVGSLQLKPSFGQIFRSRRVRILGAGVFISILGAWLVYYGEMLRLPDFDYPQAFHSSKNESLAECAAKHVDWSRFAYTQYVTNSEYLCNSVMLFEILHRLGSKADRLMMYPADMHLDSSSDNRESRLLLKAQTEYGVHLMPIQVQHRTGGEHGGPATWADSYTKLLAFNQTQYDRVLSLDSDSTVLQPMDELFLLPPAPVAMPRAYWLEEPYLSSQLVLIEPSVEEFTRIQLAINDATTTDFDMEIVNNLYGADCMIIPHRRYDLLTGEFRSKGTHKTYLGNEYEQWDPVKMLAEAKFLHFSDWPVPKPWITAAPNIISEHQPTCDAYDEGEEDCRARDMWLGFYSDFKTRREARNTWHCSDNAFDNNIAMRDGETKLRQFDALCYEDVRLLVRSSWLTIRGAKRRPKSTIFFFTEVDDPIFYHITHLVSLAIADAAIEESSLTSAERAFEHTFRDSLNSLKLAAGILEKLTSYYFQRGTANIVDRKLPKKGPTVAI
ncbi:hypothetical protein B7494_g3637 [Chlorociboria aeruginascens]|nr:hypothetical protein B7494_g3637 [Chlorociboria aeruginascens]